MFILLKGKSILEHFKRQRTNNGLPLKERKFSIVILSFQLITVTIYLGMTIKFWLNKITLKVEPSKVTIIILVNTLGFNIEACLVSLLAYQSCYVAEILREITRNFYSFETLRETYKKLITLRNEQKSFDNICNKYIFVHVIVQSIKIIITLFTVYFQKTGNIYMFLILLTQSFFEIFILFFISDNVSKAYTRFLKKFEELEPRYICETRSDFIDNICLINRLHSMKEDMCFTAFGLYKIDTKTFITILSQIITLSVILIQTT